MSDYMLTAEELRLRGLKRKRLIIAAVVVVVLVLGAVFLAKPVSHQIKAWQARRHADKAFVLIEKEQWNDARGEAIAAFQLWPGEPQALRAVARLLSRTRQPDALQFWQQLREKQPLTREDLRDEATIALVAGEIGRAEKVVQELLAKNATPSDWILRGQIALRNGARDDARAAIDKIQQDPKATEREQFQSALLALAIAGSAPSVEVAKDEARAAWGRIETIARGTNPISLEALIILARQVLSQRAEDRSQPEADDTAVVPPKVGPQISSTELSRLLENHPLGQVAQKLIALDLLEHEDPSQREALITRAITEWKEAEPAQLASLATWLNAKREFQRQLDTISIEKAVQNRDLFLQHLDALGALGRWDEIKRLLEVESFPLDPVVQFMYVARCNAQLGEKVASENNWRRALEEARGDTGKLISLAEYAEKNGATETASAAYATVASAFPKLRVAQQGRLRMAQASGDTKKIHAILVEMLAVWPNDTAVQNDEAYLRLLRLMPQQSQVESRKEEVEKGETESAKPLTDNEELITVERLAAQLVQKEPSSLPHRTLLALARLLQNRPASALEVYSGINVPATSVSPSALTVHAAVLAANGNLTDARTEANQVPVERLLPEERGLIAALLQ